jgi:hypothetical protein
MRGRLAAATIGAGLLLALAARGLIPAAPPLYDGVVVNEPYRWLSPPPGAQGGAQGASATGALENGKSPLIAIATPEQPPQAQVFGPPGVMQLPTGTTSILMSIQPIPPEGTPSDGQIAGNVYRVNITNQAGDPLTAPADAYVSLVMRGPEGTTDATIERYSNGQWKPLDTSHAGYTSGFLAIVTEFGDFALVSPSGSASATAAASASGGPTASSSLAETPTPFSGTPGGGAGIDPLIIVVLAGSGLILAATAFYAYRRRPSQASGRRKQRQSRRRR